VYTAVHTRPYQYLSALTDLWNINFCQITNPKSTITNMYISGRGIKPLYYYSSDSTFRYIHIGYCLFWIGYLTEVDVPQVGWY
jgi:hypothetical protein